jgi:integrase
MSIFKPAGTKYYSSRFMLNSQIVIRSTKTTNKAQAKQFETQLRHQVYQETMLGNRPAITIENAFKQHLTAKQGSKSHRLIAQQLKVIARHFNIQQHLHQVQDHDLHRLVLTFREAGLADETIRLYLSRIRGVIKTVEHPGYRVPTLQYPNIERRPRRPWFLTQDEEQRLLQALDPDQRHQGFGSIDRARMQDLRDFVICLLDTGCRQAEIAQLTWKQVDFTANTVHIIREKTGREDILLMTKRLQDILRRRCEHRGDHEFVFCNQDGGPRKYRSEALNCAYQRAALHDVKGFHVLRHTHASRLAQAGVPLYKISRALGHADYQSTTIYAHLCPDGVAQEVADVLNGLNG